MHIVGTSKLEDCWRKHPETRGPLEAWYQATRQANWETPIDVMESGSNVRTIPNGRAVFNIKGNKYRLIVAIRYDMGYVRVRFADTHAEYDKIDATTV